MNDGKKKMKSRNVKCLDKEEEFKRKTKEYGNNSINTTSKCRKLIQQL